jgi:hypothetical protein
MKYYLFLGRLASICGFCFLVLLVNKKFQFLHNNSVSSTIAVLGYPCSYFLNIVLVLGFLLILVIKKQLLLQIPTYFKIGFAILMVLQIVNFIYL